jgi:hypothetical protein
MFRNKVFESTLTGFSYRIFIEGLKSPITKAAYTFALQNYMKYLKIDNPDDLLKYQDNPKFIQNQIYSDMLTHLAERMNAANAISILSESLSEERAMPDWIRTNTPDMVAQLWPEIEASIAVDEGE